MIPMPSHGIDMHTIVFRPPGKGPFPLVIINHGSLRNAQRRADFPLPEFRSISRWFVARGYAVALPQRPGHGATGGPYIEDPLSCENADYFRAGIATALSIATAAQFLGRQPFVQKRNVIVVGQSAGGWGALALASRNPPFVAAVINFAGGRGGRVNDTPGRNCAPERLIAAAARFGKTARTPMLWIYTRNDSFFGPELSQRMADAFRQAGGNIEFHLLPAFGEDGHRLMGAAKGVPVWAPIVEAFLARVR